MKKTIDYARGLPPPGINVRSLDCYQSARLARLLGWSAAGLPALLTVLVWANVLPLRNAAGPLVVCWIIYGVPAFFLLAGAAGIEMGSRGACVIAFTVACIAASIFGLLLLGTLVAVISARVSFVDALPVMLTLGIFLAAMAFLARSTLRLISGKESGDVSDHFNALMLVRPRWMRLHAVFSTRLAGAVLAGCGVVWTLASPKWIRPAWHGIMVDLPQTVAPKPTALRPPVDPHLLQPWDRDARGPKGLGRSVRYAIVRDLDEARLLSLGFHEQFDAILREVGTELVGPVTQADLQKAPARTRVTRQGNWLVFTATGMGIRASTDGREAVLLSRTPKEGTVDMRVNDREASRWQFWDGYLGSRALTQGQAESIVERVMKLPPASPRFNLTRKYNGLITLQIAGQTCSIDPDGRVHEETDAQREARLAPPPPLPKVRRVLWRALFGGIALGLGWGLLTGIGLHLLLTPNAPQWRNRYAHVLPGVLVFLIIAIVATLWGFARESVFGWHDVRDVLLGPPALMGIVLSLPAVTYACIVWSFCFRRYERITLAKA